MTSRSPLLATLSFLMLGLACYAPPASSETSPIEAGKPTVLITGANRGLGLEFARQYAADGWQVIATARKPDRADELAGLGADVVQLDVTDQASVDRMAAALADRPIDVLINNAGIFPRVNSLESTDIGAVQSVLEVNVVGPMRVTKALLPNLRQGQQKKIVNISSYLGSIEKNATGGAYGYRESKAAINMFSRTLAADLGSEGFISIALHPGWVKTDMGGAEAPLEPEESIRGMRAVIQKLTAAQNGTYWGHHGDQVPW